MSTSTEYLCLFCGLKNQYNITNPDCLSISGPAVYFNILKKQGIIKGDLPENLECHENSEEKDPLDDLDKIYLSNDYYLCDISLLNPYICISNKRDSNIKDFIRLKLGRSIKIVEIMDLLDGGSFGMYMNTFPSNDEEVKIMVIKILSTTIDRINEISDFSIRCQEIDKLIKLLKIFPINLLNKLKWVKTVIFKLFAFKKDIQISQEDFDIILDNLTKDNNSIPENKKNVIKYLFGLNLKMDQIDYNKIITLLL